jgi:hypothetical protein
MMEDGGRGGKCRPWVLCLALVLRVEARIRNSSSLGASGKFSRPRLNSTLDRPDSRSRANTGRSDKATRA